MRININSTSAGVWQEGNTVASRQRMGAGGGVKWMDVRYGNSHPNVLEKNFKKLKIERSNF